MSWYTYILLCDKKIYYTGLTGNLRNRLRSHITKNNLATKRFSTIKLVYSEKYATRKEAENREQQIKRWKRAKKKALITGNLELLKKLSKS
jgi:putative endonuclease